MAKNIVIVESPAKAKTLEKFLGKDFKVLASYGHVRDLPRKGLGVDREHDYKPSYELLAGKEKTLSIGPYPEVSLATARKKSRAEAEKRALGVDPPDARRVEQERERVARLNTFELMARTWHERA